jgi:hypothetical protein
VWRIQRHWHYLAFPSATSMIRRVSR